MSSNEHYEEEEIPWISFSDATIALLFIFIATTFWFMIQLKMAEQNKQAEIEHLRGAQTAGQVFLTSLNVCLENQENDIHFTTKLNTDENSISLFIEPKMMEVVEWFEQGSSLVTMEASQVLNSLRGCIVDDIQKVASEYTVLLTLEGHTDAQSISRTLQERYPSNWELSGARASSGLRRLLCLDGSCSEVEKEHSIVLHKLTMNRDDLQIIAAGRADTQPAWQAICDRTLNVGSITPELDRKVCKILLQDPPLADRNQQVLQIIEEVFERSISEFDVALQLWANTPLCIYGVQRELAACEDRLRKMRRVDLRISVRPKLDDLQQR